MVPEPAQSAAREYRFREMRPTDVAWVHRLETLSYAFPWSAGVLRDSIKPGYESWLLLTDSGPGVRIYDAADDFLVGYGVLSYGAGEAHLLNLCVHPASRGCSLGRKILHHLLQCAVRRGVEDVFLEVRVSNRIAHRLYLAEGFREIARRANYYPHRDGNEDAIVLTKSLAQGVRQEKAE